MIKIRAFWFYPLLIYILVPVVFSLVAVAIIVVGEITGLILLVPSGLVIIYGIISYFKDKIIISDDCCSEYVFNKLVKKMDKNNIVRIAVVNRMYKRRGEYPIRTIIIDDGTFNISDLKNNIESRCLKNVSWIMMDYSKKRIRLLSESLNVPVENIG